MFNPIWDDDDSLSDVASAVVEISQERVSIVMGLPCVTDEDGNHYPVGFFVELDDLTSDDTHDLRQRWFATEQQAREHEAYTMQRYRHPQIWESFIQL